VNTAAEGYTLELFCGFSCVGCARSVLYVLLVCGSEWFVGVFGISEHLCASTCWVPVPVAVCMLCALCSCVFCDVLPMACGTCLSSVLCVVRVVCIFT